MSVTGPVTLLMLSGGIRSLAVLVELLSTTEDQVLIHHVQLSAADFSNQEGLDCCQQIVDYCSFNYRALSLSQSKITCRSLPLHNHYLPGIAYEASLAGRTYSDKNQVPIERCILAGDVALDEPSTLSEHVRNCYVAGYYPEVPPKLERVLLSREKAFAVIPEDLLTIVSAE